MSQMGTGAISQTRGSQELPKEYLPDACMLWAFSRRFSKQFRLVPFTIQELVIALMSKSPSPLIAEVHTNFANILLKDLKEKWELGTRAPPQRSLRSFLKSTPCHAGSWQMLMAGIIQALENIPNELVRAHRKNTFKQYIPPSLSVMESETMQDCGVVLNCLLANPSSVPFRKPMHETQNISLEEYRSIVEAPIHLGIVKQRMLSGYYAGTLRRSKDANNGITLNELYEIKNQIRLSGVLTDVDITLHTGVDVSLEQFQMWLANVDMDQPSMLKLDKELVTWWKKYQTEDAGSGGPKKSSSQSPFEGKGCGGGVHAFANDVRRIWDNCFVFFPSDAPIMRSAKILSETFEELMSKTLENLSNNERVLPKRVWKSEEGLTTVEAEPAKVRAAAIARKKKRAKARGGVESDNDDDDFGDSSDEVGSQENEESSQPARGGPGRRGRGRRGRGRKSFVAADTDRQQPGSELGESKLNHDQPPLEPPYGLNFVDLASKLQSLDYPNLAIEEKMGLLAYLCESALQTKPFRDEIDEIEEAIHNEQIALSKLENELASMDNENEAKYRLEEHLALNLVTKQGTSTRAKKSKEESEVSKEATESIEFGDRWAGSLVRGCWTATVSLQPPPPFLALLRHGLAPDVGDVILTPYGFGQLETIRADDIYVVRLQNNTVGYFPRHVLKARYPTKVDHQRMEILSRRHPRLEAMQLKRKEIKRQESTIQVSNKRLRWVGIHAEHVGPDYAILDFGSGSVVVNDRTRQRFYECRHASEAFEIIKQAKLAEAKGEDYVPPLLQPIDKSKSSGVKQTFTQPYCNKFNGNVLENLTPLGMQLPGANLTEQYTLVPAAIFGLLRMEGNLLHWLPAEYRTGSKTKTGLRSRNTWLATVLATSTGPNGEKTFADTIQTFANSLLELERMLFTQLGMVDNDLLTMIPPKEEPVAKPMPALGNPAISTLNQSHLLKPTESNVSTPSVDRKPGAFTTPMQNHTKSEPLPTSFQGHPNPHTTGIPMHSKPNSAAEGNFAPAVPVTPVLSRLSPPVQSHRTPQGTMAPVATQSSNLQKPAQSTGSQGQMSTSSAGKYQIPQYDGIADDPNDNGNTQSPNTSHVSSGNVQTASSAGNVQTTESAGNVQTASSAGNVQTTNSAGNVQTTNSAGNVQTTNSAGNVQTTNSAGNVQTTNSAGNVQTTNSAGNVQTTSSPVNVQTASTTNSTVVQNTSFVPSYQGQPPNSVPVPQTTTGRSMVAASESMATPSSSGIQGVQSSQLEPIHNNETRPSTISPQNQQVTSIENVQSHQVPGFNPQAHSAATGQVAQQHLSLPGSAALGPSGSAPRPQSALQPTGRVTNDKWSGNSSMVRGVVATTNINTPSAPTSASSSIPSAQHGAGSSQGVKNMEKIDNKTMIVTVTNSAEGRMRTTLRYCGWQVRRNDLRIALRLFYKHHNPRKPLSDVDIIVKWAFESGEIVGLDRQLMAKYRSGLEPYMRQALGLTVKPKPPVKRVVLLDRRSGNVLSGPAAPVDHQVQAYLAKHPSYVVYNGAQLTPEVAKTRYGSWTDEDFVVEAKFRTVFRTVTARMVQQWLQGEEKGTKELPQEAAVALHKIDPNVFKAPAEYLPVQSKISWEPVQLSLAAESTAKVNWKSQNVNMWELFAKRHRRIRAFLVEWLPLRYQWREALLNCTSMIAFLNAMYMFEQHSYRLQTLDFDTVRKLCPSIQTSRHVESGSKVVYNPDVHTRVVLKECTQFQNMLNSSKKVAGNSNKLEKLVGQFRPLTHGFISDLPRPKVPFVPAKKAQVPEQYNYHVYKAEYFLGGGEPYVVQTLGPDPGRVFNAKFADHSSFQGRVRTMTFCKGGKFCDRLALHGNFGYCEVHRAPPMTQRAAAKTEREKLAAKTVVGSAGKAKSKKRKRRTSADEEDTCYICLDGGELVCCDVAGCGLVYHAGCLKMDRPPAGKWECPVHEEEESKAARLNGELFGIVDKLCHMHNAFPFLRPVSGLPEYGRIVKQPIALQHLRFKTLYNEYENTQQVKDDLNLLASNCHLFCDERYPDLPPIADRLVKVGLTALRKLDVKFAEEEGVSVPQPIQASDSGSPQHKKARVEPVKKAEEEPEIVDEKPECSLCVPGSGMKEGHEGSHVKRTRSSRKAARRGSGPSKDISPVPLPPKKRRKSGVGLQSTRGGRKGRSAAASVAPSVVTAVGPAGGEPLGDTPASGAASPHRPVSGVLADGTELTLVDEGLQDEEAARLQKALAFLDEEDITAMKVPMRWAGLEQFEVVERPKPELFAGKESIEVFKRIGEFVTGVRDEVGKLFVVATPLAKDVEPFAAPYQSFMSERSLVTARKAADIVNKCRERLCTVQRELETVQEKKAATFALFPYKMEYTEAKVGRLNPESHEVMKQVLLEEHKRDLDRAYVTVENKIKREIQRAISKLKEEQARLNKVIGSVAIQK